MKIVGRKSEINELDRLFRSDAPEFVAVERTCVKATI